MIVTVANKTLKQKPLTNKEKGIYWGDIIFRNIDVDISGLSFLINNGYSLTYQFKDPVFTRGTGYQANYYLGTQFICIDIDKQLIDAHTFVNRITKYKPTIYHTTFWNKTVHKDNKWCYHLIYVLDRPIYGEKNFHEFFKLFSEEYHDDVDQDAKDCHRCIYTTNSSLEHYQFNDKGQIYSVDELCREHNIVLDDPTDFDNIEEEDKPVQQKQAYSYDFHLDDVFFNKMNTLRRGDFVNYYELNGYPHYTQSVYGDDIFKDSDGNYKGYADLRGVPFYVVPTAQYRWDTTRKRYVIYKVPIGSRSTMLKIDAIAFMKIIPNVTKEHLVCCLIREVYRNFDNSDHKYTNDLIIKTARDVWHNIDTLNIQPVKRTYLIDYVYWYKQGIENKKKISAIIRGLINKADILELYDFSTTLERNLEYFHQIGKKTCKTTLVNTLKKTGQEYITEKDVRNSTVKNIYYDDTKRSNREIARIYKDNTGKYIDHKTVSSILSEIR